MNDSRHLQMIRFSVPQSRVITRAQAIAQGASSTWITDQVVNGLWQRLAQGIYLTHSAPPSWFSKAQAALFLGGSGAFLSHEAAWFLSRMQKRPPQLITVSIPAQRYLKPRPGIRFFRRNDAPALMGRPWHTAPEETALDLIARITDPVDVIGLLTHGFRAGLHPNRVLDALGQRRRFGKRRLVLDLLSEIEDGVESPLEYLYDRDVERAHGLPQSVKQKTQKINQRWIRLDRLFAEFLVRIELDGELAHPGGRTNADTWRDNAVLVKKGEITLRYRWHHVIAQPCETAGQIVAALKRRGWKQEPKLCKPNCQVNNYFP